MSQVRAPIPYYGGKGYMYKEIIALFPPHRAYVEPFAGAAWVLLNKPPSPIEVYNDLDGEVVNLFRVLRDQGDELKRLLELTPYARGEFIECLKAEDEDGPVERARKCFVRMRQGFSGVGKSPGYWSYDITSRVKNRASTVSKWLSSIDSALPAVISRLSNVQIECLDALDIIPRYDTAETLFYCDPPYVHETRSSSSRRVYTHEMSLEQHRELLTLLNNIEGMAIVSGYPSDLYDEMLAGWERHVWDVACHSSCGPRTREGKGGRAPRRIEVVWCNPAAVERRQKQRQMGLFS